MGTKNGKRVQCNMGAKNHAVVMPDANKEQALNGIIGAAFGAAGQVWWIQDKSCFVNDCTLLISGAVSALYGHQRCGVCWRSCELSASVD